MCKLPERREGYSISFWNRKNIIFWKNIYEIVYVMPCVIAIRLYHGSREYDRFYATYEVMVETLYLFYFFVATEKEKSHRASKYRYYSFNTSYKLKI